MRTLRHTRIVIILMAVLAGTILVHRVYYSILILSNRHLLYSFGARGQVSQYANDDTGCELTIWTDTGEGTKALGLSIPLRRAPSELRLGATFAKDTNSWLCNIDGTQVDLSRALPRF